VESGRLGFAEDRRQSSKVAYRPPQNSAGSCSCPHTRRRTRTYITAKKANSGNGRAFSDGFTIDVTTDGEDTKTVSLPLIVHADLTANPKGIENFPNLDSYLDAVVTEDGRFVVKDFHLGARKQ
jgi:hypothetical protein